MKKVIGIFLTMVFVFVVTSMVFGETEMNTIDKNIGAVYTDYYWNVNEMVDEWCRHNGYENYVDHENSFEDGIYRGSGILNASAFEKDTNEIFSFENAIKETQKHYDCNIEIKHVGYYENYKVYQLHGKSETDVLGTTYHDDGTTDYYEVDLIFMVVFED